MVQQMWGEEGYLHLNTYTYMYTHMHIHISFFGLQGVSKTIKSDANIVYLGDFTESFDF